ncbi:MAG: hypothetical protein ACREFD_17350 [Stellaceae bacterium]
MLFRIFKPTVFCNANSGGVNGEPVMGKRAQSGRITAPGIGDRGTQRATALRTHEAVCAERYGNLLSLLESTIVRVARLELLVVIVAGSVICGMGGIIFTLALKLRAN